MKDIFKISGKKLTGAIQAEQEKEVEVTWKFTRRPGGWVIAESSDGRREKFMLQVRRNYFSANLRGSLWFGEWLREDLFSSSGTTSSNDSDLVTQFPGKVRKILSEKGALVQEGDPLLLIEAMKMEFSIKAPFTGKVSEILVQEGQQITPGDRLVDMEAIASAEKLSTDI